MVTSELQIACLLERIREDAQKNNLEKGTNQYKTPHHDNAQLTLSELRHLGKDDALMPSPRPHCRDKTMGTHRPAFH